MMDKFPIIDIKKTNFSKIFHLIYQSERNNKKLSKQDIARKTELSLPTVTQNLKILQDKNMIFENGKFSSSGGRKAIAYSLNSLVYVSLGLEIYKDHCSIVMLNLIGEIVREKKIELVYKNLDSYYRTLSLFISIFIEENSIEEVAILGLGIGIQGLVSADGSTIIFGKVLDNTDVNIDVFSNYFSFPCRFVHDAECVALAEQWLDPHIDNALILSIGEHLGGALFINGEINNGVNYRSATIEHTIINPEGPRCYCGKEGCVEVYCSLNSLTDTLFPNINYFFTRLREGNKVATTRWLIYLENLATAIDNFHMFLDNTILISGTILNYLHSSDYEILIEYIKEKSVFPETDSYIRLGYCKKRSVASGAGLLSIKSFIEEIT